MVMVGGSVGLSESEDLLLCRTRCANFGHSYNVKVSPVKSLDLNRMCDFVFNCDDVNI